jgi:oxygen-independent coproporphyrinogen-3 oxidase
VPPPAASRPGLYVHVPFCARVCPYCDFSVLVGGEPARRRYVERLLAEIPLAAADWKDPEPFDTVYFGGGTPSILPAAELARVLDACHRHLPLVDEPWTCLEANPEDVTAESCAEWRALGVRMLSLGVQSFDDAALRFLERQHDAARARAAVETALAAGFATVSVDLIYGLPDQDEANWRRQLETLVGLAPGHVSCYQLTIHERTRFGVQAQRGRLRELPDERQAALFELTHRYLADAGWPAYEVSNFAREPEQRSRHNRKYWDHTPYLGLGPSAHSLAVETPASARRFWNELRTPHWERRLAAGERPLEGEERLGPHELATEALMLGLRTAEGVDLDAFARRYGVDLQASNAPLLAELQASGQLILQGRRLVPTLSGFAVADGLAAAFTIPS